jgi:hypothetical protein
MLIIKNTIRSTMLLETWTQDKFLLHHYVHTVRSYIHLAKVHDKITQDLYKKIM